MVKYVMDNPKRLATRRLMPDFFHVQHGVEIGGKIYDAVGNAKLLMYAKRKEVHVRQIWVDDAEKHGNVETLQGYMQDCVQASRDGAVMISPYISKYEKVVLRQLLDERLPLIYLASNGFGDYYRPQGDLFEAVAAGEVLILSPWIHDPEKKKISRSECVQLNALAEEIAKA